MPGDANPIPITVYLKPSLKKKLDRACTTHGYTITGFARGAIMERLERLALHDDSEALSKAVSRS